MDDQPVTTADLADVIADMRAQVQAFNARHPSPEVVARAARFAEIYRQEAAARDLPAILNQGKRD